MKPTGTKNLEYCIYIQEKKEPEYKNSKKNASRLGLLTTGSLLMTRHDELPN